MTRKHYVELAQAINLVPLGCTGQDLVNLAERVADVLSKDNPRFDRQWFIEACCKL
jgi:hypothetical protein